MEVSERGGDELEGLGLLLNPPSPEISSSWSKCMFRPDPLRELNHSPDFIYRSTNATKSFGGRAPPGTAGGP
jgi:hypothetical protein